MAVICVGGVAGFFKSEIEAELVKIRSSEATAVQVGVSSIERVIESITRDLAYLASQGGLIDWISHESKAVHSYPLTDWLAFSRAKGIYDQIRWLTLNGQERVRVNFNNGRPTPVPEDRLQNKGKRYYFTDTIKLNRGEFFVSPLDLNIERGKIEQPLKPMIRIGTPIFDRDGKKQGIVLLNYLGEKMLREFGRITGVANSHAWLLNRDGYWLKGPSANLEWGFMYQRSEASMTYRHLKAWKQILAAQQGQFEDEQGLWTFATAYPLIESQKTSTGTHEAFMPSRSDLESSDYFWKVVRFLPREEYHATMWQTGTKLLTAITVLLVGLFIGCWKLASTWVHQRESEEEVRRINEGLERTVEERTRDLQEAKKQAEEQARTDALTGMNNRRAFFEYGKSIHEQSRRYGHSYTLIMLDIDFFKKVNDTCGHQVGDEALKAVADAIAKVIRFSDVEGRIGGEEFAIILPETSIKDVKGLAERLRQLIADIVIPLDGGDLTFTASFGVAGCNNDDTSIEDVMTRADNALYQAKEQGRDRVAFF